MNDVALFMAEVAKELAELRRLLEVSERRSDVLAYTIPQAAKRLGVGLTKFRGLLKSGAVQTVAVGGREMVPASELNRVLTPRQSRARELRVVSVPPSRAKSIAARKGTASSSIRDEIDRMLKRKSSRRVSK